MKEFQFKFNSVYSILIGLGLIVLFAWLNLRLTSHISEADHFFPSWNRTRLFLTEGLDPYGDKANRQTQRTVYGRTARSGEDQLLFAYPFYSMLVFSPFAAVENYALAQGAWMTALEIALIAIAITSAIVSGWRPPWGVWIVFLVFTLVWFYGFYPLMVGNLSLIVAMFITLAILFVMYRQDHLAGILLALATIKPNMVILVIPFVLWWAFSQRRLVLVSYFFITLALLLSGAFITQPDWLIGYLRQLLAFMQYAPAGTPTAFFTQRWPAHGLQIGRGLSLLFFLLVLREWIVAYRKDENWFLWTCSLTLAITPLVGVQTSPTDYMLAFPALVLLFSFWEQRWGKTGRWFSITVMGLLLAIPWLSYWRHAAETGLPAFLFFFLPTFLVFALYWMRYWTLSVRKMPVEKFEDQLYY